MSARFPHSLMRGMVPVAPYAALFFFVTPILPVQAQELDFVAPPAVPQFTTPPVTEPEVAVDELVRRALADNPQLPISRQTQEAAQQRLLALRSFQSPILELVPGLAGNAEARDDEVLLSQPLDVFGRRRAQAGVAAAELRRTQAETTLAERTLVVQVKNSAAELFAVQEAESLGQVQVEVARLFRDAAARRAELGDVPPVQVQRAELELLRVENELTNAQAERLARRAVLNQLIGQAPETPLRVALPLNSSDTDLLRARPATLRSGTTAGTATESAAVVPTTGVQSTLMAPLPGDSAQAGGNLVGLRAQVLPGALTARPDVMSAQAALEARQAQVQVLRRERFPIVELQARRSAFFGREGSYGLRAVVTVPLLDFGSLKRERRAVEAEVRAQESTVALLRSQVAIQVEQALLRLQQQQQTVERYRSGIVPLTLDLLRKTQIGYAQGASTYLEVLEAQRTLRQVQTEYLQALVGTRTQEAALEGALGAAPSLELLGALTNPVGPAALPGTAAPGTVPEGTVPPLQQEPLSPPSAEAQPR